MVFCHGFDHIFGTGNQHSNPGSKNGHPILSRFFKRDSLLKRWMAVFWMGSVQRAFHSPKAIFGLALQKIGLGGGARNPKKSENPKSKNQEILESKNPEIQKS